MHTPTSYGSFIFVVTMAFRLCDTLSPPVPCPLRCPPTTTHSPRSHPYPTPTSSPIPHRTSALRLAARQRRSQRDQLRAEPPWLLSGAMWSLWQLRPRPRRCAQRHRATGWGRPRKGAGLPSSRASGSRGRPRAARSPPGIGGRRSRRRRRW